MPHGALREHLFRFGTDYTLSWHGEGALEAVVSRLTDYAYLNARCGALPAVTVLDLVSELERVVALGAAGDAPAWLATMEAYVTEKGQHLDTMYFFYTTCPKCARHYGKNYVVGVAKVSPRAANARTHH